jgi:zinc protease
VAVQQRVVQAEAAGLRATPHGQDAPVLAWLLYPGHPYGRDLTGLAGPGAAADLAAVDAGALRSFYIDRYGLSRCVLAIAGDIDLDATEAWVRSSFGGFPSFTVPERAAEPVAPLVGEHRAWLPADVGSASLYLGWRGVPMGHPDEPALAMLAWLMATDSRLERRLVDRGRARQLQAWSDAWQLGGGFVISVRTEEGRLAPLLRAVDRELLRVARVGPSEVRLERARGAWQNRWLRVGDTITGRASLAAQCVARDLPPGCAGDELARTLAVTAEDVQRVAQGLVDAPGRVLLSVASEADYERSLPGSDPVELPR